MILQAKERKDMGSNHCRRLRAEGFCPAVVYGPKQAPEHVVIEHGALKMFMRDPAVMLRPFNLEVNKKKHNVIVKSYALTSDTNELLHVDFYLVSKNTALQVSVPLKFLNEEKSPGVVAKGLLEHRMTELAISALPKDVPDNIEVDVGHLAMGDVIHLSQITIPKGVTLQQVVDETHDPVVAAVSAPKVVEEVEEITDTSASEGDQQSTGDDSGEKNDEREAKT